MTFPPPSGPELRVSPESPAGQAAARPLLTVCVPTYNRADRAEAAVLSLIAHLLNRPEFDCEVVVADNASTDGTSDRLAALEHPRLRKMRHAVHLPTVEENILRSLGWVRGEYVWFLGDDDPLRVEALPELFALLESRRYGLLVFNSPTISADGRPLLAQPVPINAARLEMNTGELVEAIGVMYTLAGVSNLVQRTDALTEAEGLAWLKRAPIYSHVAWFADAQRDAPAALINAGLVHYRQNDYADGHWRRAAERQGVADFHFWSLGLARLLDGLVERGTLSYRQVGATMDTSETGARFRLIDEMLFNLHRQFEAFAASGEPRQAFTRAEFDALARFLLAADPLLYDLVRMASDARDRLEAAPAGGRQAVFSAFSEPFKALFAHRQASGQNQGRWQGELNGYAVYRTLGGYVGIDSTEVAERERVLRYLDPLSEGDHVLVADSLGALETATRASRQAQNRSRAPVRSADSSGSPSLDAARTQARQYRQELAAVRASTSWRITAPLRRVVSLMRGGRR